MPPSLADKSSGALFPLGISSGALPLEHGKEFLINNHGLQ